MLQKLRHLLFPPKCILCRRLLPHRQADLCPDCRIHTEEFAKPGRNIPFVEKWTAVWYYGGNVQRSILRYKFYGFRSYAGPYGQLLAMKIQREYGSDFDLITWTPISARRRRSRGYDQTELLARSAARELGLRLTPTLQKHRHTKPQSSLKGVAFRRANVMGAYRVLSPETFAGKRVLLVDDIITTGATVSECARLLLTAGAKEVYCAALAAPHPKK